MVDDDDDDNDDDDDSNDDGGDDNHSHALSFLATLRYLMFTLGVFLKLSVTSLDPCLFWSPHTANWIILFPEGVPMETSESIPIYCYIFTYITKKFNQMYINILYHTWNLDKETRGTWVSKGFSVPFYLI